MFNIGYRTIYQKNIRSAIKEAKKNGFKVIEIHLTSPQFIPSAYSSKELKSIKSLAIKESVILQVHTPLEQSLIFVNKELRSSAKRQVEEMIKFFGNRWGKWKNLAVNYTWEDLWWKRKNENIPWLEKLIRI